MDLDKVQIYTKKIVLVCTAVFELMKTKIMMQIYFTRAFTKKCVL